MSDVWTARRSKRGTFAWDVGFSNGRVMCHCRTEADALALAHFLNEAEKDLLEHMMAERDALPKGELQ